MTSGFPPITPAFGALKRPPNLECGGHAAALRAVPWAPHSRCDSRHPSPPPPPPTSLPPPFNSGGSKKGGKGARETPPPVCPIFPLVGPPLCPRRGRRPSRRSPHLFEPVF